MISKFLRRPKSMPGPSADEPAASETALSRQVFQADAPGGQGNLSTVDEQLIDVFFDESASLHERRHAEPYVTAAVLAPSRATVEALARHLGADVSETAHRFVEAQARSQALTEALKAEDVTVHVSSPTRWQQRSDLAAAIWRRRAGLELRERFFRLLREQERHFAARDALTALELLEDAVHGDLFPAVLGSVYGDDEDAPAAADDGRRRCRCGREYTRREAFEFGACSTCRAANRLLNGMETES